MNSDNYNILYVEDEPSTKLVSIAKAWVVEALTQFCYKGNRFDADLISFEDVTSLEGARQKMKAAQERYPGRGYDALICDLEIFPREGANLSEKDPKYGLDVIEEWGEQGWPGPVIVVSSYAEEDKVLMEREARRRGLHFDEWLEKQNFDDEKKATVISKLQRSLIPIEWIARELRRADGETGGIVFEDSKMRRILREIASIAQRSVGAWPLSRILLQGDPGSGKGAIAKAFSRLLSDRQDGKPRKLISVNCASLVGHAHGGRIALFGCENFQGIDPQPGLFEAASSYKETRTVRGVNLAASGAKVDLDSAGVLFLDEFAELDSELQASILVGLEEGVIRREGSLEEVEIGCHVICATNASIFLDDTGDDLPKVRDDLLDRLPDMIVVPTLAERKGEVDFLIKHLAQERLRSLGVTPVPNRNEITISGSARRTIMWAVEQRLLTSVRQLQAIALIERDERAITEGNLLPIIGKIRLLEREREIGAMPDELPVEQQARVLQLPAELVESDLPRVTSAAIMLLFHRFSGTEPVVDLSQVQFAGMNAKEISEARDRAKLLSLFVKGDRRHELFRESEAALKTSRSRILSSKGIKASGGEKTQGLLKVLLQEFKG